MSTWDMLTPPPAPPRPPLTGAPRNEHDANSTLSHTAAQQPSPALRRWMAGEVKRQYQCGLADGTAAGLRVGTLVGSAVGIIIGALLWMATR